MRFYAKLTFEFWKTETQDKAHRFEQKIFLLVHAEAAGALEAAKALGRESEHRYTDQNGNAIWYRFLGVSDLRQYRDTWSENQVWEEDIFSLGDEEALLIPDDEELIRMV